MSITDLNVAAVQCNPLLGDLEANAAAHRVWIDQARCAAVDLLVFPELSLTGYGLGRRVAEVALPSTDPMLRSLADAAGDMQVVLGFVEQRSPGEYANALAILQHGQVIAVHRKLYLPTYGGLEEGKWFTPGNRLTRTDIRSGWTASHLICADLWNPGLVHAAALQRPDVLCAPVNSASGIVSADFSNEHNWGINLRFHAMTYGLPVVMANRYGLEGDQHFWGGSRILGPRGETLAQAEDRDMLITATLSQDAIARARLDCPTLRDANTPLVRQLLS